MIPSRHFRTRRAFLALAGGAPIGLLAASGSWAEPGKPKRILLVTVTKGFRHDSIPAAQATLRQLANTQGWEMELADTDTDLCRKLTREGLKRIDLIIFANTTGELPIPDKNKKMLLEWLRAGHAFVGMHAAADTLLQWQDYGRMIGGYFDGHPWFQKVRLKIEAANFSGTEAFADDPELEDEIYQFRDWSRKDKQVILSIDNTSIDASKGKRDDKDYAVSWVRGEGRGRVFYTSLGHREQVWQDRRYREHILGGIRWTMGLQEVRRRAATH
jgi:type 1 glutamine amidotransferase